MISVDCASNAIVFDKFSIEKQIEGVETIYWR